MGSLKRSCVEVRDAVVEDAPALVQLWADHLPRSMAPEDDMRLVIKRAAESRDDRILIATHDGAAAGAAYLQVTNRSPIDPEPVLNLLLPEVAPDHQRHGVGHALLDAGVAHAEQRGIAVLRTASGANNRSAQRFMARLAFSPMATFRAAPTHVVRQKLAGHRPRAGRAGRPSLPALLAQRRSQRRDDTGQ